MWRHFSVEPEREAAQSLADGERNFNSSAFSRLEVLGARARRQLDEAAASAPRDGGPDAGLGFGEPLSGTALALPAVPAPSLSIEQTAQWMERLAAGRPLSELTASLPLLYRSAALFNSIAQSALPVLSLIHI